MNDDILRKLESRLWRHSEYGTPLRAISITRTCSLPEKELRELGLYLHKVNIDLRYGGLAKWYFTFDENHLSPDEVKRLLLKFIHWAIQTIDEKTIVFLQRHFDDTPEYPASTIYWVQFKVNSEEK